MTEPRYHPRRAADPFPVGVDSDPRPPARSGELESIADRYGAPSQAIGLRPTPAATHQPPTPQPPTPQPPTPQEPLAPTPPPDATQLDLFARLAAADAAQSVGPARRTSGSDHTIDLGPSTYPSSDTRPDTGTGRAMIAPIEFRGLTKVFGSLLAVDQVSFTVQPGRVTGFLGPNGAGKTTTLRMLVGLAAPTAGSATFGELTYRELDQPQRTVGTALDASFHPGRSGRDHLRVLAATAQADDQRVDELLELVDLTPAARRKAGGYSLGMRQRLSLASALLGDPDYLILDEPANGLDPKGIRWLRGFLRSYAARGKVVLVSSHMLGEVQETVDDVVVIGHGRLLRCAPIDQIELAEPTTRVRTTNPARTAEALAGQGFVVHLGEDADGRFVRVASLDTGRIGEVLLDQRIALSELTRETFNLEESFFRMVEQAEATASLPDRSAAS